MSVVRKLQDLLIRSQTINVNEFRDAIYDTVYIDQEDLMRLYTFVTCIRQHPMRIPLAHSLSTVFEQFLKDVVCGTCDDYIHVDDPHQNDETPPTWYDALTDDEVGDYNCVKNEYSGRVMCHWSPEEYYLNTYHVLDDYYEFMHNAAITSSH